MELAHWLPGLEDRVAAADGMLVPGDHECSRDGAVPGDLRIGAWPIHGDRTLVEPPN